MRRRRVELGLVGMTAALTSAGWWAIATLGDDEAPAPRVTAHTPVAERRDAAPCASCSVHGPTTARVEVERATGPVADAPVGTLAGAPADAAVASADASEQVAEDGTERPRGAVGEELARLLADLPDGLEPSVELWLALSTLHAQAGHTEDVARCVEAAFALDPESEEAQAALAGLPPETRRPLLEKLVEQQPTNDELIGDLADTAAELGDTSSAIAGYLQAMELDPRDSEWAGKIATLDPVRGAALLERAAGAQPERADIQANLAQAYFAQGRDGVAFAAFERALALDPEDDQIAGRLVKMDAGRAVPFLERALATTPDRDELWGDLAEGYAALDRTADAVRAFRRARELDPQDDEWSQRLLQLDPGSELASAEARARASPGNDELWGDLGDAYASSGRTSDALAAYRRAADLDPEDGEWAPKIAELEGR